MSWSLAEQWRASSVRLALVYSALFACGIFAMLLLVYWQATTYIDHRVDRIVQLYASRLREVPADRLVAAIEDAVAHDPRRINYYGLFKADRQWVVGNLKVFPAGLKVDGAMAPLRGVQASLPVPDGEGGAALVRAMAVPVAQGQVLVVGRDLSELAEIRRILLNGLVLGGVSILIMGVGCGFAFSFKTLRRIHAMRDSISSIMRGELHRRIPVRGRHDDLDVLAGAVNQMLDELERLMTEVKGVTDTLAHDLRTPLTRLRLHLARAQQTHAQDPALAETFDRALRDIDVLMARFRAILRIAEIETGLRKQGFALLDLRVVLREVAELFDPLADEKQVRMRLDVSAAPSVEVYADHELMLEALSNLVDNALKFTPAGGEVCLRLMAQDQVPVICVEDTGPGIAPEERSRIVQRFYRGPHQGAAGHGLGLSIVQAIARLHGFNLRVADSAKGAHICMDCGAPP
ncbi:MAG: HAMP domain-containing histidine kinase [Paucibacter sp.]|nr:HAMP domain-containing histidine kinase [Roseateles sp.]